MKSIYYLFALLPAIILGGMVVIIITTSKVPIITPVNGTPQTTDILLLAGELIDAGHRYEAHYSGNRIFFVSFINTVGPYTWEVEVNIPGQMFILGSKCYELVQFQTGGGIIIKSIEVGEN